MKILILFSSRSGQTYKIAQYIATALNEQVCGNEKPQVELVDLHVAGDGTIKPDLSQYQGVVIGASVRYGHFHRSLNAFIMQHYQILNAMPSAFYAVNLTARKAEKRTPQTNIYTRKFLEKSPWQPGLCEVFAGAVCYSRYTWYQRLMVRLILTITGGETDTNKDVEYTDWQQVSEFAHDLSGRFTNKMLEK